MNIQGINSDLYASNNSILFDDASCETETNSEALIFSSDDTSIFTTDGTDASSSQTESADSLKSELDSAQDEQGFIGKLWNGFKNLTGLGLGSDDVEDKIEQYENGEITYDEALESIESYETKQESASEIIANSVSGLVSGVITIGSGGTMIAAGALIGGSLKAGIKTVDRATNNIEDDELDAKQIAKDFITGAADGAVSAGTSTMLKPLTTASIAGKSMTQTVKTGIIQGAKAGAISGTVTGAVDYTVEAAAEEDVDFTIKGLLSTTAQNALIGGVMGGAAGGITNAVQYKTVYNKTMTELQDTADSLAVRYKEGIGDVESEYKPMFDDLDSVKEGGLTARAKSNKNNSVFNKLKAKYDEGTLTSTDFDSCAAVVGDGYGIRIQLENLDSSKAKNIVESALEGTGKTYDDFVNALNSGDNLSNEYLTAIDRLKEAQTGEIADRIVTLIDNGDITLAADEFNNYGTELSSYFTDEQLGKISQAYYNKTDEVLDIVNKTEVDAKVTKSTPLDDGTVVTKEVNTANVSQKAMEKADKSSGYTTTQGNTTSTRTTGKALSDTELQIRGSEVNEFAEVEHVVYDIRQGKITAGDSDYSSICDTITKLSDKSYADYNSYLKQTYKYLRMKELGIEIDAPTLAPTLKTKLGKYVSTENLTESGLQKIKAAISAKKS